MVIFVFPCHGVRSLDGQDRVGDVVCMHHLAESSDVATAPCRSVFDARSVFFACFWEDAVAEDEYGCEREEPHLISCHHGLPLASYFLDAAIVGSIQAK